MISTKRGCKLSPYLADALHFTLVGKKPQHFHFDLQQEKNANFTYLNQCLFLAHTPRLIALQHQISLLTSTHVLTRLFLQ